MTPNTEQQNFWAAIRQGWVLSIIVGLAVLLIRFKALIPLVWQILVKNGAAHTISNMLNNLVLLAAVIGGCILCIYAVRTGYRKVNQALESNDAAGSGSSNSAIALHVIGRMSLLINAPILYWAVFLFVLLPQLLKIPNASLRIGTTAALAGAFIAMAVIVILTTHIGLALTKFSYKSINKPPEHVAPFDGGPLNNQLLSYSQPDVYALRRNYYPPVSQMSINSQPSTYPQPESYYPPSPQPAPSGTSMPPARDTTMNSQPVSYPPQNTYVQPESRPTSTPAAGTNSQPAPYGQQGYYQPIPQPTGMNNGAATHSPEEASSSHDNSQPWR